MDQIQPRSFEPIKQLAEENLAELLSSARNEQLSCGSKLLSASERNWFVYLLDGTIRLRGPHAKRERIIADSERAGMPLFLDPSLTEFAVTLSPSRILKVDRNRYEQLLGTGGVEVNEIEIKDHQVDLVKRLMEDYRGGRIAVPSMPESATKVQELAQQPDASLADLSALIEGDPPIAGKLVSAANSALVAGRTNVCSVRDALVRLGMKSSSSLAISFAFGEMFQFSKPELRGKTREIWHHMVLVAAFSRVLAEENQAQLNLDPEKAFMVGLLHDLGAITLLSYLDTVDQKADPATVNLALENLRSFVTVMVLQEWGMDQDFINAAQQAGNWEASGRGYVGIVNVSKHQAWTLEQAQLELPELNQIAACEMLLPCDTDVDGLLPMLKDNPRVDAIQQLFG